MIQRQDGTIDLFAINDVTQLAHRTIVDAWSSWETLGAGIASAQAVQTPNGTIQPVHHLLNVSFHGPAWITGGGLGIEASFFMYPLIALMFLYLWRRRFVG